MGALLTRDSPAWSPWDRSIFDEIRVAGFTELPQNRAASILPRSISCPAFSIKVVCKTSTREVEFSVRKCALQLLNADGDWADHIAPTPSPLLHELLEVSPMLLQFGIKKRKEGWLSILGEQPLWFLLGNLALIGFDSWNGPEPVRVVPFDSTTQLDIVVYDDTDAGFVAGGLQFKADCAFEAVDWIARMRKQLSIQCTDSFCPERHDCSAKWLVDAFEVFKAIEEMMENAQSEVVIVGGWVSTEVQKQEHEDGVLWIRSRVLKLRKRGVVVKILCHDLSELNTLRQDVARDDDLVILCLPGDCLWAFHEKLVIVDRQVAYLGSIDPFRHRDDDCMHGSELPWHDVCCLAAGRCVEDFMRHVIDRWNAGAVRSKEKHGLLYPREYARNDSFSPLLHPNMTVQVLRSAGLWSIGKKTENSIMMRLVSLIRMAKRFIYIENSFFISKSKEEGGAALKKVRNRIAEELVRRIVGASRKKQVFRVVVVLPMWPAVEGAADYDPKRRHATRELQLASIDELEARLLRNGIVQPSEYISFFALQRADEGKLVTEKIHVHSKIMLVDDRHALIGSANLNDRSLLGDRDTEIALHLSEKRQMASPFVPWVRALRIRLMAEHTGMLDSAHCDSVRLEELLDKASEVLNDPCDVSVYNCPHPQSPQSQPLGLLHRIARENTMLFSELFPNFPTSTRFPGSTSALSQTAAKERVRKLTGSLVEFPRWEESSSFSATEELFTAFS